MKFQNFFLTIIGAILLSGCQGEFRNPICSFEEFQIPQQMIGTFRISQSSPNPALSGVFTFEDNFIQISENAVAIPEAQWIKLNKKSGKNPVIAPTMAFAVCKIGDFYYSQKATYNGTYMMSRVDFSDTGFTLSDVYFDPEKMRGAGIALNVTPEVENRGSQWASDTMGSQVSFVINNAGGDREKIFKLTSPSPIGFVFEKVPDSALHGMKLKTLSKKLLIGLERE